MEFDIDVEVMDDGMIEEIVNALSEGNAIIDLANTRISPIRHE